MLYVGLDVHVRQTTVCVLDSNGKTVKEFTVRGPWPRLIETLKALGEPMAVCYEACCGYGYLHGQLSPLAARVAVAHPGQLRLIFRAKGKNDRIDARKLAMLLFLDQVPQVHVPPLAVRSWRGLVEYRQRPIGKRVRAKNALRALLRGQGILAPKALWSGRGFRWLRDLPLETEADCLRRDLLLEEIEELHRQTARLEKALAEISRQEAGVALLRTIPGVGPRTAEAVVAYIDDPTRFGHNKAIGSYFGLVPRQDASGTVNRLGHITREGPASVRRLLTEAAWQGIRRSPVIRAYFERIQKGDPERKKVALVATAHYLARVMLAMLQTGEVWRHVAA